MRLYLVQRTRTRNKGFVLVDSTGDNFAVYCMETKVLKLHLALALFGENLEFVRGVDPGEGDGDATQYDIVTRAHRNPLQLPALSLGRAEDHFALVEDV